MKIGIDARLISQTGVGVYVYNLIHELSEIVPRTWEVLIYVRSEDAHLVPSNFTAHLAPYRWHSISEQTSFLALLNRDKLDLMHFTYFSYPALYNRPFVSTIHDLTPVLFKTGKASTKSVVEYYPKYFAMKQIIQRAITNSKGIIVPTNAVKDQIVNLYGSNTKNKIFVTYEGVNTQLLHAKENKDLSKQFKDPYFVYIGNFYPHKNIPALLLAFKKVETKIKLVLVGPDDFFCTEIRTEVDRLQLDSRVSFFHNPTLADLVFFYTHAQALIQPSLSEGFGLTPIEAMHFGSPVIASNIAVFKETMGNNYTSFNPKSVDSITQTLESWIKDRPKYNTQNVVTKFSFKTMAVETLDVYKKIIGV